MKLLVSRVFQRATTLYRQFGFWRGLRITLTTFFRAILDPHGLPSYSQTGEDRILATTLQEIGLDKPTGFYVDVGSNDPRRSSNTYFLYKSGWRGLCIDANEQLVQKHRRIRKNDIAVCAAVSDREQEVSFAYMKNPLVSSLDPTHIKAWAEWVGVKSTRTLKTQPLGSLFERHEVPRNFDVLSIDVEGHDFEVLTSFDLSQYRPRLIVIEIHGYDINAPQPNRIVEYLKSHGYTMVGYAVMNGYFVNGIASDQVA